MRVIDAFAGIGGFSLAADALGWETVAFVERDPDCQFWLGQHWPGVPIYGDICAVRWEDAPPCDVFTAGFPCQPHSVAGKRQASADDRDLWSECVRAIGILRPRYACLENVPGLLTSESGRFFNRVLSDLAALGYVGRYDVLSAAECGAPHKRERVWICAYRADERWQNASRSGRLRDADEMEVASLEEWLCTSDGEESEGQDEVGPPLSASLPDRGGEGRGSRSHQRRSAGQSSGQSSDRSAFREHAQSDSTARGDKAEGTEPLEGEALCAEPDALARKLCDGGGGVGGLRCGEGVIGIDGDGYIVAHPEGQRVHGRAEQAGRCRSDRHRHGVGDTPSQRGQGEPHAPRRRHQGNARVDNHPGYVIHAPWADAIAYRGADGTVRLIPAQAVAGPESEVRALATRLPRGLARRHSAEEVEAWATPGAQPAGGSAAGFIARKHRAVARGVQMGTALTDTGLQAQEFAGSGGSLWPVTESEPGRVARLRAVGNAVVPAWVLAGPFRYILDLEASR